MSNNVSTSVLISEAAVRLGKKFASGRLVLSTTPTVGLYVMFTAVSLPEDGLG